MTHAGLGYHYTHDEVVADLDRSPDEFMQTARYELGDHDTMWNPASAKDDIHGPGHVIIHRYPDGGITAVITSQDTCR